MNNIEFILWQARTLSIAIRHPRVPLRGKLAAGFAVAYVFSPIQLIPTFIPVIGQLDDVFFLLVAMRVVRKSTSAAVLAECEAQASVSFSWITFNKTGENPEFAYIDAIQPLAIHQQVEQEAHAHEWSCPDEAQIQLKAPPVPASTAPSCS